MSKTDVRAIQRAWAETWAVCHSHQRGAHDEDILSHLDPVLAARPEALAEHLSIARDELDEALDRLEKAGFVTRSKSSRDRRRTVVKLTEAGDAYANEPSLLDDKHLAAVLKTLNAAQRRKVVEGLTLLADACSRHE